MAEKECFCKKCYGTISHLASICPHCHSDVTVAFSTDWRWPKPDERKEREKSRDKNDQPRRGGWW